MNTTPRQSQGAAPSRLGLTLVELLISISIMSIIITGLSGLMLAVHQGWEFNEGHGRASQHARVALERISRAVSTATATDENHGFAVVFTESGTNRFPDTLVVWRPGWPASASSPPANSDGTARISECVIFCPDPDLPNRLLEIRAPGDNRTIPINNSLNSSGWRTTLDTVKRAASSQRAVLTDLLRTASGVSGLGGETRAAVFFDSLVRPSANEWTAYQANTLDWDELSWPLGENNPGPQGLFGIDSSMRQVWLRMEMQLVAGTTTPVSVPFFGSATLYYQMQR